jgi:hypothetical protein
MRAIILLVAMIYIAGVGVALAPTIQGEWYSGTAADFTGNVVRALPDAAKWPVRVFHG